MSWLSKSTGIHISGKGARFNGSEALHGISNLAKNLAPAAAFIPGVGVVGAGLLATAGGLGRGESLKKAAFSGLSGAAMGGGLASVGGKLGIGTGAHLGLGLGGGGAVAPTAGFNTGALPGPSTMASGLSPAMSAPSAGLASEAVGGASGNLAGNALSAGKGLLNFAEAHPNAASGALQGLGGIVGGGADTRLKNAQASRLEQEAGETRYDFERRRARDAQLAPVWGALGDSLTTGGYSGVAANPYAPRV